MIHTSDIAYDLPNCPEEVITQWLLPHAKTYGWPPSPQYHPGTYSRWSEILRHQPIEHWQHLHWDLKEIEITSDIFDIETKGHLKIVSSEHGYLAEVDKRDERIVSILLFCKSNSMLPGTPIICWQKDTGDLHLLDGFHRVAAFLSIMENAATPSSEHYSIKPSQKMWIGH